MKPSYLDALYTYGWFHYFQDPPDTERMGLVFRRMTEVEPYDYRGFHGLGYALYMKAVKADAKDQRAFIEMATNLGLEALKLRIQQLNVTKDFGEIARSVRPDISIVFHQRGNKLLDGADTASLPQNKSALGVQLLMSSKYVSIDGDRQRRAWINYQLALDHLAVARLGADVEGSSDPQKHLAEHDRLLKTAQQLDADASVYPIYVDGLAILDRLLQSKRQ